jgi:tetrahydromethanopterin S-methyltransferase subunit D
MEKHLPTVLAVIIGGALIYFAIKALTSAVEALAPMIVTGIVFIIAVHIHERSNRK